MTARILAGGPSRPPSPRRAARPAATWSTPAATPATSRSLLLAALQHYGPAAGPLLAAAVAIAVAGRAWLRRRQHAAFADGARLVTVLAPPQASPDGAVALWGHLTGLLRPPWARLWHGQPHLGWEYAWAGGDAAGMTIRLWVPGTIPPGLIERAAEAAWPGAHTVTAPAAPPLPAGALVAGGTLRLARPEILPLSASHDPEAPLRALAGAAAGLGRRRARHRPGPGPPGHRVPAAPRPPRRPPAARRAARPPGRPAARRGHPRPGRAPAPARDAAGPGAGRRGPRRDGQAGQRRSGRPSSATPSPPRPR